MQVGIDSFAAALDDTSPSVDYYSEHLKNLIEQIEFADQIGLDVFGIGEHHRKEFLDSSCRHPSCSSCSNKKHTANQCRNGTECCRPSKDISRIRTLDLLSQGRAEMIVGRGSFIETFPLFGLIGGL